MKPKSLAIFCSASVLALVGCEIIGNYASSLLINATINTASKILFGTAQQQGLIVPTREPWGNATPRIAQSAACLTPLDWNDPDIARIFPLIPIEVNQQQIYAASAYAPSGFTLLEHIPVREIRVVTSSGATAHAPLTQHYRALTLMPFAQLQELAIPTATPSPHPTANTTEPLPRSVPEGKKPKINPTTANTRITAAAMQYTLNGVTYVHQRAIGTDDTNPLYNYIDCTITPLAPEIAPSVEADTDANIIPDPAIASPLP